MTGVPMQPTFAEGAIEDRTQAARLQAVRELVAGDTRHPSVALCRELDPTRPVTIVNVAGTEPATVADLVDVLCLNRYAGGVAALS